MRFYGMSFLEVMGLPLRTFWSLNANVSRLRAEEHISMIELFLMGGMGATQESVTQLRESLNKQMGEPAVMRARPKEDHQQTQEGIQKLRELKDRMRN